MIETFVRLATRDDLEALTALLLSLFSLESEFVPDEPKQRSGIEQILAHPETGTFFVVVRAGEIIGMANLLYTVSTALGGRVALLEDVVIKPGFRRKGYGKQLLAYVISHAREQGCLRLTLLTDADNQTAIGLYRGMGFQSSAMVPLRLPL
ncbi:MAG: GNAT family N-acetyltransferase [Marinilabiliales bacterium]|nr:GNAT family N-acetyltransferase [Marinilabiliales bacterium]